LLPAPTAPSEGSAGLHGPDPEGSLPKVLAHQLRRRFPSDNSLRRGDRPSNRLRFPKARLPFNYRCLAEPKPSDVLRPFLGRPLLRPASLLPSEDFLSRVALEEDQLFRRLFPTGPKNSEELLIACRRRSVLPSPSASFLPLPAFRWRRGLPSRSPFDNAPRVRVGEVKNSVTSLWITGILGTTADCIVTIAIRDSRDSLSVLLRDPDNGRIGPSSRVRRPSRFVPPAGSAPAAR